MRKRRNSKRGSAPLDLLGHPIAQGVGARRAGSTRARRGGGYLGVCTGSNFEPLAKIRDPGVDELRAMGMPSTWLKIAEAIGSQNFLVMWRLLDEEPAFRAQDGGLECSIRSFRSYLRFQRNRYIEELAVIGWDRAQIQAEIERQLCEKLSINHISRLLRHGRSGGRP